MAGALANVATLHLAAAFVVGCWLVSVLSATDLTRLAMPRYQLVLVLLMFGLLLVQASTGRGFVVLIAGFYLLLLSFVFYQMLKAGGGTSLAKIVRSISFLQKFFLIGLIIEFVIIVAGGQPFLREVFFTTEALSYRLTVPADIPRMLGIFDGQGGLNSLLLGPQISGMLALYALVWFVGIQRLNTGYSLEKHLWLWISIAVLMFLMCVNGTVAVLAMLAILMYALFVNRRMLLPAAVVFIVLVAILSVLITNNLLFERIFSGGRVFMPEGHIEKAPEYLQIQGAETLDFYIFAFSLPFTIYNFIGLEDILLGVGAEAAQNDFKFLGADVGFFVDVVAKSGAVWALFFVTTMIYICFPALQLPKRKKGDEESIRWRTLASVNAFLGILWIASTAHYNQALNNSGGVMVFALHLAVVMYARRRAKASESGARRAMSCGTGTSSCRPCIPSISP